ncbi:MAG TPA: hypothetical protein PLO37_06750 [Candidatus Hydrogenedentes bacterium]|nr:hypothetical protein [Candidatus Hydrogenedentota bacterium]HPG66530.1 hypothetical protein [Candidatus Hydrogenedentota bacterium]
MAAINLRRFSKPETLHRIAREHLIAFLGPYRKYLVGRGVTIPPPGTAGTLDYEELIHVLLSPDAKTPQSLIDALFFVNELAAPESFDALQDAVARSGLDVAPGEETSPADLAIQVWMQEPELLERLHAQHFLSRPRSFEYFRSTRSSVPPFLEPDEDTLRAIERSLDEWFVRQRRGRTARVAMFAGPDSVWFLVRHGEPFTRESAIEKGESGSVYFRPAKFDVLVYNRETGELRINATGKTLKRLYREVFGLRLFGDGSFFDGSHRFTLEPLRRDGKASLVCSDIHGLEWVKLKEIHLHWLNEYRETEIHKADDVFAAMENRGTSIPIRATIAKAAFEVKFEDAKTPRTVVVGSENKAQYKRDDDAGLIERWMLNRGFISFEQDMGYEDLELFMAAS